MKARALFIAVAALAVGITAIVVFHGGGHKTGTGTQPPPPPPPPKGAVSLVMGYSPEKEAILTALIGRFNKEKHLLGTAQIVVEGQKWSSGDAEVKISQRRFKPEIWSPSSSLWGRLLNYQARHAYVGRDNPSLVRTPLVIAIWESEAKALGWPQKPLGFADILGLATSKAGWGQYGLPGHGQFKLGHTNPDFSTSGLSFVAAQYYTAAGKLEGLTVADVESPAIRKQVRAIESSIVHYGDTTLFFADQMKRYGPAYASAAAMEEATLIDANRTKPKDVDPLVPIYPREGTFVSDNPFLVLDAPWVTPQKKRAAEAFGAWLVKQITPQIAADYGFRPGDPTLKPVRPKNAGSIDLAQPKRVLGLPEPLVLARIKQAWHSDRKSANILLVVDVSGSMGDAGKLAGAKVGLRLFPKQLSPRDRVGLLTFNGHLFPLLPIRPYAQDRDQLRQAVDSLIAGGDTALYDAALRASKDVENLHDTTRINAVVLLGDGDDTASNAQLEDVLKELKRHGEGGEHPVRIFTIAYGDDANESVLTQIAEASGGKGYTGNPSDIESVYLQISSFF